MKKRIATTLLLVFCCMLSAQQAYRTTSGHIRFNASTPLEDIDAVNKQVNGILLTESGELGLVLLNTEFTFPRALMQEHFNENYMESETFPKSTFRGTLAPLLRPGKESSAYEGTIEGELTIHGVTRKIRIPARVEAGADTVRLQTDFTVRTEDYDIKVPKLLFAKIAREIQVEVRLELLPEPE